MASHPIHQQPRPTLPNPMFIACGRLFTGQNIVDSQYPPNDETAICHIVGIAGRPFLHKAVHHQRSNLQCLFTGKGSGRIAAL